MKFYKFTAVFVPEKEDRNIYTVYIPALPGCISFGESLTEARYNIREALELYLSTILEDGEAVPQDKKIKIPKNAIKEDITAGIGFEIKTGFSSKPTPSHVA